MIINESDTVLNRRKHRDVQLVFKLLFAAFICYYEETRIEILKLVKL